MLGLTPKQKEELNQAIHEYLLKNRYSQCAEYFEKEANIQFQDSSGGTQNNQRSSQKNILESKWKSVISLKKQEMEL